MKNIILQHYTGDLGELEILSKKNMEEYADKLGAEYRLLSGNVFHPELTPPCQKLAMFDEQFDDYDTVVMVDIDMFTRKGMVDSIFSEKGIGVSTGFQRRLKWKNIRKMNGLLHWNSVYWGGAIWRLERDQRIALRKAMPKVNLFKYNGKLEDEGIMHQLARHAGIRGQDCILPGGEKWAHGSYLPDIEKSALIHIRPRTSRKGPRVRKIDVYRSLVEKGII